MDDQFDKDLTRRVREVFDKYEDTSADKGWTLLREKYPEKAKRSIAWVWWSSAAAILLLCLGILWLKQSPEKQQPQVAHIKKPANPNQQPQIAGAGKENKQGNSAAAQQPDHLLATKAAQNITVKPGAITPVKRPAVTDNKQSLAAVNTRSATPVNNTTKNLQTADNQNKNSRPANASANATTLASAVNPTNTNPPEPTNITTRDTANASASKSNVIAAAPGVVMQQPNKFNGQLLADNSQNKEERGLSKNGPVRFGVYAATYFNYAKGSSSQFNVGAGLSADINLSRKLRVSTGIAIAQNSLSYPGQPNFSTPAGINLAPLALYSASTLQYSMSEPSFRNYSANLVGIDIPVNLKYTFDPGKSETYLLAGLSSGTFINETYTYSFSNAQAQSQSARGGFYFAKMLNLAIGTGYRIGNNRLIIEPFLKYPLDGLGTQQIRFGSGGVNLKFSIPSSLKR